MKKEKYIFLSLIVLYSISVLIFLAKILIDSLKNQKVVQVSDIPEYSLESLRKASQTLEKREKIDSAERPNLDEYKFGQDEPFK